MNKAPIVMIGFNRPEIQRMTLENVVKAEGSKDRDIYAFIDGPREGRADDIENSANVAALFEEYKRNLPQLVICKREKNLGCRGNIIASVTEVVNKYGRVIVIEDDILVSRTFLRYMDEALDLYQDDSRIWCINAYVNERMQVPRAYRHDVYLTHRFMCFGWATWKDRWNAVDHELKCWPEFSAHPDNLKFMHDCSTALYAGLQYQLNKPPDTWDVQCSFHLARTRMFSINPRYPLTKNNGSGAGVHSLRFDAVTAKHKYYNFMPRLERDIQPDSWILEASKYMATGRPSRVRLWIRKLLGVYDYRDECCSSILSRVRDRIRRYYNNLPFVGFHMEPIDLD